MAAFIRRYRSHCLFFTCLYIFYLITIFGVAYISDISSVTHTCIRVLAPALELGVFFAAGLWLLRHWRTSRNFIWWLLYMLVAAVTCLVYAIQFYSVYLSDNFVSILALQNAHYISDELTAPAAGTIAGGIVWIVLLGLFSWRSKYVFNNGIANTRINVSWRRLGTAAFIAMLILYVGLFTQQRKDISLEPSYLQTPVASLAVNTWKTYAGTPEPEHAVASSEATNTSMCFVDPGAGKVPGYKFQKPNIYKSPLPFARRKNAPSHPNLIIFFTEGTSTRLIGAYGGKYPGLTPNIDRLAKRSMQVVNYFNHTAATYRGITGQNSSGWTFANGNEWNKGNNGKLISTVNRQTIPRILNHRKYNTYFFEPENPGHLTKMLGSLGFRTIYDRDKISDLLNGNIRIQNQTQQLDDSSLFRGLETFLKQRTKANDSTPFYIATYNIGTHAFIPMVHGGTAYGNGHSRVLNKLHNYDAAIGKFLDYFYNSPYAKNTIVAFTTDHATYPDKDYRKVVSRHVAPYFVDTVPLLIYDPVQHLPAKLNAQGRDSLDLAPTVLQLLGIQHVTNSFMGHSLFEPRTFALGFSALGPNFYITVPGKVYALSKVPNKLKATANCEQQVVQAYYLAEEHNHIYKPPVGWASLSKAPKTTTTSFCSLDLINGSIAGHKTTLHIGSYVTLAGWFAGTNRRPVGDFTLQMTGTHKNFLLHVSESVHRPDVAKAIGGSQLHDTYGFNTATHFNGAAPGTYAVDLQGPDGLKCHTNDFINLIH